MSDEHTTRVLTTSVILHAGNMIKPRVGYRLRVTEELIPATALPQVTKGAPRKPGP